MASNFKIVLDQKKDTLYLRLTGDFDGSSACELFNVLRKNGCDTIRIVICTDELRNIVPFGRDVFRQNLCRLNGLSRRIFFSGEKSRQIVSDSKFDMKLLNRRNGS